MTHARCSGKILLIGAWATLVFSVSHLPATGVTDGLLAKGDALDQQLKTKEALAVFLEAEKTAPDDPEVLRRVAKGYAEAMADTSSKDEQRVLGLKAVNAAKRAVAADPKNALAHLALAICYGRVAPLLENKVKIENSRLVKSEAETSIAIDPSHDYAYHVLGAWNYELAGLNPVLRAAARLVYGAIPDASYEDAVKYFKKAIALAPNRVAHHVELGRTYVARGQVAQARLELSKGLELPSREKDDPGTKERAKIALGKL